MSTLSASSPQSSRTKCLLGHAGVEEMIRRLEEACLRVQTDDAIPVMRRDSASSQHIPQRVREIIVECLTGAPVTASHLYGLTNGHTKGHFRGGIDGMSDLSIGTTLEDENALLQKEVRRLEALLKKSRAEREDLGEKYISVSERLERALRLEQDSSDRNREQHSLQEHISRLKQQLSLQAEEHDVEIKGYQDSQDKQASLVQKLQSKLLQYKHKCEELESKATMEERRMSDKQSQLEQTVASLQGQLSAASQRISHLRESHSEELQAALMKVDEEQKRTQETRKAAAKLQQQVQELRAQNQRLTTDIHKLTADWTHAREMLEHKDRQYDQKLKSQMQVATSMFKTQVSGLLPALSTLKTQHLILRTDIERDVGNVGLFVANALKEVQEHFQQQHSLYEEQISHWHSKCDRKGEELRQVYEELDALKLSSQQCSADYQHRVSELTRRLDDTDRDKLSTQQLLDGREELIRLLNEKIESLEKHNSELTELQAEREARLSAIEATNVSLQKALKQVIGLIHPQLQQDTAETGGPMLSPLSVDRVSPIGLSHASPSHTVSLGSPRAADKVKKSLTFTRSRIPVRRGSLTRSQELVQSSSSLSQSPKQGQSCEMSADEMLSSSSSATDLEASSKLPTGHSADGHQMPVIVMTDGACDSGVESLVAEAVEAVKLSVECRVSELEKLQMQVKRLESECQEATHQAESAEGERSALAKAIVVLKTDLAASSQNLSDVTVVRDQYRGEVDRIQNECDDLKRQLSGSEACTVDMQTRLEKLKNELHQLTGVNRDLLQTRQDLEVTNRSLSEELESMKEQLSDSQQKVDEGEEMVRDLENEVSQLNRQVADQKRNEEDFSSEISQLKTKRQELQSSLQSVEQARDELERRLARNREAHKASKEENIKLIGQTATLEGKVAHLESQLRDITMHKDGADAHVIRLSQSNQKLNSETATLQHQVARYQTNVQQLNDQLVAVQRERTEFSTQLTQSQQHARQLEQSLLSARTQLGTTQQTVKQLAEEKAHVDVENTGLERRLASLVEENSSLTRALETARSDVREASARVTEMKTRLEGEVTKLAVECETRKQLELQLSQTQARLSETVAEKEDEVMRLLLEKQELENTLEEINEERDRLVSGSQEERDSLIEQFKREDERKRLEAERLREEAALTVSRERRVEVSRLESEKNVLADKLRDAQRDRDITEAKMASMRSVAEVIAVERERDALMQRVQQLESELRDSEVNAQSLGQKLMKETADLDKVTAELQAAMSSVDGSRRALDENKQRARDLESSRHEYATQLKELKGRLKFAEQEKEEAMRETERVRQRLRDLEERKRSLQREKAELLSSVAELERSRGGDQVELNGLKLKVSQDESELLTLGMQLENTKHKLGAAQESRVDATKENLQLRMCHQDWEEQCSELRRHAESLSLKVTQLREAAAGKESEVRQLALKLESEMKLKSEAQSQVIECQRKLQLEARASEEQRCRIAALEAQVGVLTGSSVYSPKSQSAKLRQTVEESQQQLKTVERTKAALETQLYLQEAENANLSSQLLVVKEDRNRLQRDLQTLISAVDSPARGHGTAVTIVAEDAVLESGFHSASGSSPGTKLQIPVRLFSDYVDGNESVLQTSKPTIVSPSPADSSFIVRQIQDTLASLKATLKDKEREMLSIRSQVLEKDTKVWELEASMGKMNARLDGLLAVAGHFTSPGQSPVDKLSALERALRTQNEGQLKANGEASALKADVDHLKLKLQSTETELESALEQNLQLRASRDRLLEEQAASDRQAQSYVQERKDEMEKVRRQLSATGRDLLESRQREQRNAGQLKRLNGELKQLEVTVSQQKQESTVLAEHKRILETELIASKKIVARLEGELTALKHQLLHRQEDEQKLRSYKSSLQQKGSELESTVLIQKASMAERQAKLIATEKELEANQREVSRLDSDLKNCAGERDILRKRVEILKGTQTESENQVALLQLRVTDLQRILNHTETSQITLSRELKVSEELRRQMRGESKLVKLELEKAKRECEQAQSNLSKCLTENARLKSEYEQERERYRKLLDEFGGQTHISHSLAQDLESERESLKRKLMVQEAENKELQAQVLGLHGTVRRQNDDHAQRLFEIEVAHETELQRRYNAQHKTEGETVDRLRQTIRELEAKVTRLQTELADRARKKQRYIAKTAEKDREIRQLQDLLSDSLRHVAGSTFHDPDVLQRETDRLNRSAIELGRGEGVSRLRTLSPVYSSTPRNPEKK